MILGMTEASSSHLPDHPAAIPVQAYQPINRPAYPAAHQWMKTTGAIGLVAATGISVSCSTWHTAKEKPLIATSGHQVISGYHDYLYTTKAGDTLASIAKDFYDTTAIDNQFNDRHDRYDAGPDCAKIATANPKLNVASNDTVLPVSQKILIPNVGRISYGS